MRLVRRLQPAIATAATGGLLALALVVSPTAAQAQETKLPASTAPMWQTNGTVSALAATNTTLFAGGSFTSVRPPGAAAGTGEVARSRFAAFNSSSGALITSINHNFNGNVFALAVSPDGKTVYAGGDFTTVDGATRNRIAAFDSGTGALTSWTANVNARVTTIAVSPSGVYVGGAFSSAGGRAQQRVAMLSPTSGLAVSGFTAAADAYVYSVALSTDFSKLYIAGEFTSINGDTSDYAAAAVDSQTGAVLPFSANSVIPRTTDSCRSVSKSVKTDADGVYFANEGTGGGCFDGTFSANNDGTLKWVSTCLGATQALQPLNGTLYTGSHSHDCSGDKAKGDPIAFNEVGWSKGLSHHLGAHSTADGHMEPWFPNTDGGPNGGLGPRSMTSDGTQLFVGGEFTTVNGQTQQGLARFSPSTGDQAAPATPAAPTAVARAGGKVSVFVQAPLDNDDIHLTVRLYRDSATTPIATQQVRSVFQQQPVVAFTDNGLAVGSKHTYRVDVAETNGSNVSPKSAASNQVTVRSAALSYENAVMTDTPSVYWPFADSRGTAIADASDSLEGGKTWGSLTYGQAGPISGNDAIAFDGATGSIATTDSSPSPTSYSVEAWFKTTSTTGGKIIGFGDNQQGWDFSGNASVSGSYDKHVYMTNDGRIVFGVYNGSFDLLSTRNSLNDGQWHQVVGTQGPAGMTLYVDGTRIGRNTVTTNQSYQGYWRVGGDNLGAWPDQPTSNFFNGSIGEVAVYDHPLSLTSVDTHYAASGRTPPTTNLPTDSYGKAVTASDPTTYWRADETSGPAAADSSANGSTGTYSGGYTLGGAGAVGTGTSVKFNGTDGGLVSDQMTTSSNVYTEELWFKTSSTSGGKLIGFGNANSGLSSNYDRHVYMTNDGHLVFGVWNGQPDTATSPNSYNDGQWHYLVASQGAAGMKLWVDDHLVDSNSVASAQPYSGYWHVGGDNLGGWPNPPSSQYFDGSIDEVAVYPGVTLSPADIDAHYAAAGRSGPDNQAPTTSITSPTANASVASGVVNVAATAADNVAVTSVALEVDGAVVATVTDAPYTFTWNATDGQHTLQTVATDAAGNTGRSPVVTVTAATPDTTAPTTTITSPNDGDTVTQGNVAVAANAADNVGVSSVSLQVDGTTVATDTSAPYTFVWEAAAGNHTLRTVASDAAGNNGASATINVTVVPPPDTTSPTAPGTLVATTPDTTSVHLSWNAATDDRGVTGYRVVRDGTVLPTAVTSRTFDDTGLAAGSTHTYVVRAFDAAGNTGADSNSVTVTLTASALYSDTWPGADGAAWPTAWTTSSATGTADTQGGAGRLTVSDAANSYARAQLTGVPSRTDSDVLMSYRWNSTTAGAYFSVFLRGSGGWQNGYRPSSGYGVQLSSNSGTVVVQKNVAKTVSTLASVTGAQAVTTSKQWLRLKVSGSTIQFKIWTDGQAEPAAWKSVTTDTSVTSAGQLFVSAVRAGSTTGAKFVELDNLQVRAG